MKTNNRRDFIKTIGLAGGISVLGTQSISAMVMPHQTKGNSSNGEYISLQKGLKKAFKPLENISISSSKSGTIVITDGNGNEYLRNEIIDKINILAGGALGYHTILLLDKKNKLIDFAGFKVDAKTEIIDKDKEFSTLLKMLHFSTRDGYGSGHFFRIQEKLHFTYAGWFQDHVHVLKAMKYFDKDIKSGVDMWADAQRENGMLADNCYQDNSSFKSWHNRFGDEFVWRLGNEKTDSTFNIRIPVENMSEFTFLEAVYYIWKATGDDEWMANKMENCKKAIEYATSNEYRWSEKYKLLKRGHTIDIWDFQPAQDVEIWEGDLMMAKPGVTKYSIMYGDNVGMAVGCKYVGEMLNYLGKEDESKKYTQLGNDLQERLDKLCWNGKHYLHHVPEDPSYTWDFGGTNEDEQVTISSAYAINRRIGHEKSVALIKAYQKIRDEMPASSPGEFYLCYPPYEKGWHNPKWEYMNGGVSPIVGGELAHGAFENGFEEYGVEILRKCNDMAQISGNFLKCIYRGAMPEKPERSFTPVILTKVANADTHGDGAPGVPGWTGEGNINDLHEFPSGLQVFYDVPFQIVDPAENSRKACLILSGDKPYVQSASLRINKKSKSIYLLHTHSRGKFLGNVTLRYTDGTFYEKHIIKGENISEWWFPKENKNYKVAWRGKNEKSSDIGAFIYGFDNPHPEKTIKSIDFTSSNSNHKWMVLGVTLGEEPTFFMPSPESYGAPDNWAAAAVIYALLEGLAGLKDTGVAFNKARLSPRWDVAGVKEVSATSRYEASNGYLSYNYKKESDNKISISFTGSSTNTIAEILIPKGKSALATVLNGETLTPEIKKVESSEYLVLNINKPGVHNLEITLA